MVRSRPVNAASRNETRAYFARVPRGLEEFAVADIRSHFPISDVRISHRTIEWNTAADPRAILELRSVEDVFLTLVRGGGAIRHRAALGEIASLWEECGLEESVATIARLRPLPPKLSFGVTASFVGRRNYSRFEIAESTASVISLRAGWRWVGAAPDVPIPEHDLDIRLVIEEERVLGGVRLAASPLYKRRYRKVTLPGALNPVVAYHMLRLAAVAPGGTVCDPCCGTGIIPLEALGAGICVSAAGFDISVRAIDAATANSFESVPRPMLAVANACVPPLAPLSVDAVVSDLPWERQTNLSGSSGGSLEEVISAMYSMVKPGGSLVLLSERWQDCATIAKAIGVRDLATCEVSLYGSHPHLVWGKK